MSASGRIGDASAPLAIVLAVRFLLELTLLTGAAVLAWNLAAAGWRWPAAIFAVAAVATLWGLVLSPKAKIPLARSAALWLEATLFVGVGVGLLAAGFTVAAVAGVAVWVVDRAALALLQRSASA